MNQVMETSKNTEKVLDAIVELKRKSEQGDKKGEGGKKGPDLVSIVQKLARNRSRASKK